MTNELEIIDAIFSKLTDRPSIYSLALCSRYFSNCGLRVLYVRLSEFPLEYYYLITAGYHNAIVWVIWFGYSPNPLLRFKFGGAAFCGQW